MAADSGKHFKAVEDGEHYLTKQVLPKKRLIALAKRAAKTRARAAEIIENFKTMFCVRDREMGGWMCLDEFSTLTVPQMEQMLKRRK
jgi:hypothetical protein